MLAEPLIDDETPSFLLALTSSVGEASSRILARALEEWGFIPGIVGFGGHGSTRRARILGACSWNAPPTSVRGWPSDAGGASSLMPRFLVSLFWSRLVANVELLSLIAVATLT